MAGKPSQSSFLWQAVLILLPVAVLAVIGWASLRKDKILAEHDARERAQAIAEQLVPTLWTELTNPPGSESSNEVVFQVDEGGKLVFPPPYDPAPAPKPYTLTELSPEQSQLWAASQSTAPGATDAVVACQRFIDSDPSKRFAAAAQYQLGLLLLQQTNFSEALKSFDLVTTRYPDAHGESGLPLMPLAQFKIIELQPFPNDPAAPRVSSIARGGLGKINGMGQVPDLGFDMTHFILIDSFCSNIVYHPTLLTPFLLNEAAELFCPPRAETRTTLGTIEERNFLARAVRTNQWRAVQKWQRAWDEQECSRQVFAASAAKFRMDSQEPLPPLDANKNGQHLVSGPAIFSFTLPDRATASVSSWIALRVDEATNRARFICRPESELGRHISKDAEHVPEYFGVGVDIAGKRITAGAPILTYWRNEYVPGGKGGGQYWQKVYSDKVTTNLLASAVHVEEGMEQLRVNVYLTSPTELFASQQSRAKWFGSLVVISTVSALIGLIAAWRAFHRQYRLAEMKSNFVSSVSHELRAPIASVRLMAESLERGKVNEPQKQNEYFRFIVQECRRLSSLIENVLDFSRIEQGRKQYEFEPTDLLALTRETVKLMEPYATEKGVRLMLSAECGVRNAELEVDGRAIQQALVNLIDNAIKHSAQGQTVNVGVDTPQRASGVPPDSRSQTTIANETNRNNPESGKTSVLLFVEDHGPGIPPEEHEKIFEMFYRLGSELRRETQGVGIGLSIVKHIVEAHGGQVTVRSNIGQGSRFTIELPGINAKAQRSKDAKVL